MFGRGAMLVALGLLSGCGGRAEIFVQCKVERDVVCTVEHMKGRAAGKACWEVTFNCRNGTKAKGSACQVVEPKAKAIVRMQKKDIPGFDKCDQVTGYDIGKLEVTRPD